MLIELFSNIHWWIHWWWAYNQEFFSCSQEINDESSIPSEDDQGASLENSDCESQAKKAKENVEEIETSESENGKKSSSGSIPDKVMPKKPDKLLPCPRCDSLETKFCYYNNYNVNQPRHFCKNCQRYWTAGGTLRNVPVGAGRRKNKHSTNNTTATSTLINSHGSLHSITSCFSHTNITVLLVLFLLVTVFFPSEVAISYSCWVICHHTCISLQR